MRYQLEIDAKPAAPVRDTIHEAARDALDCGFAEPDRFGHIILHACAEIAELGPVQRPRGN